MAGSAGNDQGGGGGTGVLIQRSERPPRRRGGGFSVVKVIVVVLILLVIGGIALTVGAMTDTVRVCGADVPGVGVVHCPRFTVPDNDDFFDAELGYSKAVIAFDQQAIVCDTAAAVALQRQGSTAPGGYARCLQGAAQAMRAAFLKGEDTYASVQDRIGGTCRDRVEAWHDIRRQQYAAAQRVATFRTVTRANLPRLRALAARASALHDSDLNALKAVDSAC